jgi:archaemetzincin
MYGMKRRTTIRTLVGGLMAALLVLPVVLIMALRTSDPAWGGETGGIEVTQDRHGLAMQAARLVPLHQRKKPPSPGDWLERFPEKGQTFSQYRVVRPQPLVKRFPALYLQPIGTFTGTRQRLIDDTVAMLTAFYAMPVTVRPVLSAELIPASSRRFAGDNQQLLTGTILELLKSQRPADAVALLGLTAMDLWPGDGWNFVFGQASLNERVGVWSMHRFGDAERNYSEVRLRTVKVAVHETGHMFGFLHCTAYECVFNGANHLAESDRSPLWACPECEAKVWHATGCDAEKRYAGLSALAQTWSLKEAAEMWETSRKAVMAAGIATGTRGGGAEGR